jgi:putative phosphoesterase
VRVAAISDIHGNLPALEAVLADVDREDVGEIVVVGDTVSGPWPVEVLDLIEARRAKIVHGNVDREVVNRSDRYGPLAVWCADRLGNARLETVSAWPTTFELDVDGLGHVFFCHSTPSSDEPIYTTLTPEEDVLELFSDVDADVLVCGHTHMQYDRALAGGPRLVNPGSVGSPYEGTPGAFWALLGPDVDFRRSEYDVGAATAAIERLGAPVPEQSLRDLVEPPTAAKTAAYFESLRGA